MIENILEEKFEKKTLIRSNSVENCGRCSVLSAAIWLYSEWAGILIIENFEDCVILNGKTRGNSRLVLFSFGPSQTHVLRNNNLFSIKLG